MRKESVNWDVIYLLPNFLVLKTCVDMHFRNIKGNKLNIQKKKKKERKLLLA